MKKVLVTGSQSYIGSVLTPYLKSAGYGCVGMDAGFIKDCLLYPEVDSSTIFKDSRDITLKDLKGYDVVIHLSGISNDPFKNFDPAKIYNPVRNYTLRIAKLCKKLGIRFIFASSCSVYGKGTDKLSTENSRVYPQTPYSLNKLQVENDLEKISDKSFVPIALRFATAFGLSPRMRFDLVINMFTGMGYTTGKIILNSNGQAWRPFVHINDICKAIMSAIEVKTGGSKPLIINVGSSDENYQIITLAKLVQKQIPGCKLEMLTQNKIVQNELIKDRKIQDGVDSRNYKISFEKISKVFPGFACDFTVKKGIRQMLNKYREIKLTKEKFENIKFYRLQKFEQLIKKGLLTEELKWIKT